MNVSNTSLTKEQELALASTLRAIAPDSCATFCDQAGIPYAHVQPVDVDTPEQILNCLTTLIDTGAWPGFLFDNKKIWLKYILSIVDEKYRDPITMVVQLGTPADLINYLRACYKFGYQPISDAEYDAIERLYIGCYPALAYLNTETPDDSNYSIVVQEAIRMSVSKSARSSVRVAKGDGAYASLNSEKSTSIKPVRSYEEAYDFLLSAPKCRTHWSLKMDGFNTKVLFKTDGTGLDVALSRGRSTDSWDYTEALARMLSVQGVDASMLSGRVTGETLVDADAMETLRAKYPDKDYKSPKSAAGAMLRAPQYFEDEDYKALHFYPFECADLMKDVAFATLKKAGMNPPPAIIISEGQIPLGSLGEFKQWLDLTILDPLWNAGGARQGESDGVVLQLLTTVESDRADKYSDLNIALKFSHWTESSYASFVKKIIFDQQRVLMSVVLEVEPVTTRDLNVATRVSVGSPAILVNDNVRVGDKILFTRKSEAINIYEGKC